MGGRLLSEFESPIGVYPGNVEQVEAAPGQLRFTITDPLGSSRTIIDQSGHGQVTEERDFYLFEEEIVPTPNNDKKFTGQYRDTETNLDYFGARYYGSSVGRFMSVDPQQKFEKNSIDPQRWNLYAYTINNPLKYVDPDGAEIINFIHNEQGKFQQVGAGDPRIQQQAGPPYLVALLAVPVLAASLAPAALEAVGLIGITEIAGASGTGLAGIQSAGRALAKSGETLELAAQAFTGLPRNTERILVGTATGAAYRVPDLLSKAANFLGEVKDAARVGLTRQLRDLFNYAEKSGMTMNLFLRDGAKLSRDLLTRIEQTGARVYYYVDKKWVDVTDKVTKQIKE